MHLRSEQAVLSEIELDIRETVSWDERQLSIISYFMFSRSGTVW